MQEILYIIKLRVKLTRTAVANFHKFDITKTRLFKCIENFTTKKLKIFR